MLDADPRFSGIRILNLHETEDVQRLALLFADEYDSLTPHVLDSLPHQLTSVRGLTSAGARILSLVLPSSLNTALTAQSAVVEFNYVDRDFNVAHAQLYSRAFKDYPRKTARIHFLRCEVSSYEVFNSEAELQANYIGYVVLSPVRPRTVGRTVLPPPPHDSLWTFVPACCQFSVNLCGNQLWIDGTAFLEQDGRVAACASAATWMSTTLVAREWGHDTLTHSVGEITRFATRYRLSSLGSGASPGLSPEQIQWAMHEMGYEPMTHEVFGYPGPAELVYSYVESGIPPILIIYLPSQNGLHAVTVVGHLYDHSVVIDPNIGNRQLSSREWCPSFILHDDQVGPYIQMRIDPPSATIIDRPTLVYEEDRFTRGYQGSLPIDPAAWYKDAQLLAVVAPLPQRHTLRPEQAALKGQVIIKTAYALYDRLGISLPENPVFRTFMVPSNHYRRRFTTSDGEIASWYRGSTYARYVWVTELCTLDQRRGQSPDNLRVVADVTIDPTSSPFSADFITLHIPHYFFRMESTDVSFQQVLTSPVAIIEQDQPIAAYSR